MSVIWKDGKAFHSDGYEIKVAEREDFSGVDIDWEIGDEYDSAGDGYVTFHEVFGVGECDNEYKASGAVVCGELDENTIDDIERI